MFADLFLVTFGLIINWNVRVYVMQENGTTVWLSLNKGPITASMHLGYSKTSLRDGYLWDTSHYTHLYIHIDCWICLNVTTSGYQQDSVSLYPITHNHVASLYPGRAMYMHETWYCVIGLLKVIYFKTGSQNAAKRLRHPCYESWYPALKVNY